MKIQREIVIKEAAKCGIVFENPYYITDTRWKRNVLLLLMQKKKIKVKKDTQIK